ncbi:MAG: TerC family protein [Alphaproteobacteria bacterium]|nr:TerC family protein [Alphaproteobacteria bacterium]
MFIGAISNMDILYDIFLGKPIWMWGAFVGIVLMLLIFDLGVLQKNTHEISLKESLFLSLFYIFLACGFGVWVWYYLGDVPGKEYFTGYIIEKTLSVDNIFVMSLIFSFFHIPRILQHRVLFWGILGVLVLRALMIGLGAALITEYSWMLYIFAVFLIFTGIKMLVVAESDPDFSTNPVLRLLRKHFNILNELQGEKFFVRKLDPKTNVKVIWMTPLFVALILIELTDIIFAIDSVPAIFSITQDPFIVYTSNIFAILGLRALYFVLAAIIHRFCYLKPALALVLVFIGSKVFVAELLGIEKIPASISLSITLGLLTGGVLVSIFKSRS